jgi:DHA1 family multidrug resistance protein-like MFS transporter
MKSWRANYTALLIAETLAILGFGLSIPIIPLFLANDIGITDPVKLKTWVGLTHSSAAITLAIFAPVWGRLADTYSRKAMLLRAMFGGAIVNALMAFVYAPWQLLVLKILHGCLTGTVAAATVLTAAISPVAHVAFTLGLLQTGIAVGNSLGPLVGGFLSDFFGYRAAFFSTGLVLALAGLIVLLRVDKDEQPKTEGKVKKISLIPDIKPIISSPLLITLLLLTFGVQAANAVALPMLPLFLQSLILDASGEGAFIASTTGIVLGVGAAFTALAAVLAGKVSTRVGYWTTLIFCLAAGAAMTIPQTFVSSVLQLTILRALSSFFIGGTIPVINAIIAISSDKNHQGSIYGFNSSLAFAGMALGPMIGSVIAILNFRAMFLASALILTLSAIAAAKWRK